MKRVLFLIAIGVGLSTLWVSCKMNTNDAVKPSAISFDPQDSLLVDELMRFYAAQEIIPAEALTCQPEATSLLTFDCVSEDCEISNDFLQDSLGNTFFVEVMYAVGSAGNNNIYICQRSEEGFAVLFQIDGIINPEAEAEKMENGYKVLCVQQDNSFYEIYYDGTQFTKREIRPQTEPIS